MSTVMPPTIDPQTIRLQALPAVLLSDRHRLPTHGGLYFVMTACGGVLYIGRASHLRGRWRTHAIADRFAAVPGVRIAWLKNTSFHECVQLEWKCLRYFLPACNRQNVPKHPIRWLGVEERFRIQEICCNVVPGRLFSQGATHCRCHDIPPSS